MIAISIVCVLLICLFRLDLDEVALGFNLETRRSNEQQSKVSNAVTKEK
jgi:hypothetical protein